MAQHNPYSSSRSIYTLNDCKPGLLGGSFHHEERSHRDCASIYPNWKPDLCRQRTSVPARNQRRACSNSSICRSRLRSWNNEQRSTKDSNLWASGYHLIGCVEYISILMYIHFACLSNAILSFKIRITMANFTAKRFVLNAHSNSLSLDKLREVNFKGMAMKINSQHFLLRSNR